MSDGWDEPWTCRKCKLPILPGQAFHGASFNHDDHTGLHWDCRTVAPSKEEVDAAFDRAHQAIKRVRDLLR